MQNMLNDWDHYYLQAAYRIAAYSEDPNSKNGCILTRNNRIMSLGCNSPYPTFCRNDVRHQAPQKYIWYEHAERTAIAISARAGRPTNDCTAYCTWFSCAECARLMVWAGIKRAVFHKDMLERMLQNKNWSESAKNAQQIFLEGQVKIELMDEPLSVSILNAGETIRI